MLFKFILLLTFLIPNIFSAQVEVEIKNEETKKRHDFVIYTLQLFDFDENSMHLNDAIEFFERNENSEFIKIENKNNENECSICFENDNELYKTSCNHYFHKKCLTDWFAKELSLLRVLCCPYCKKEFNDQIKQTENAKYLKQIFNIIIRLNDILNRENDTQEYFNKILAVKNYVKNNISLNDLNIIDQIESTNPKYGKIIIQNRNLKFEIDLNNQQVQVISGNEIVETFKIENIISNQMKKILYRKKLLKNLDKINPEDFSWIIKIGLPLMTFTFFGFNFLSSI